MDQNSAAKLSKVHPQLSILVAQLISNLADLGMDVRVVQGLRTIAEQNALYAQGRSKPGKRVTNARGGQSNHNYGFACDLCRFKNGQPDWNDLEAFKIIGREAKKLGLEWGGDWKFVDRPHVQLKGMSVKECQTFFGKGGLPSVWNRMDQILGGAKPIVFIPKEDDLLEFGDKGAAIVDLQTQLAKLNFLRTHEIDGEFGKITKNAVIGFQRQHGLTADGIVGPGTKAKLKAALDSKNTLSSISAAVPANLAVNDQPVQADPSVNSVSGESLNQSEPSPIPQQSENPVTVSESTTEKTATPQGEIEKTVTATTDIFNAKNIPAFIPRFGKQWALGLIPGGGFVATILAKLAAMPDWLVFMLGFFSGVTAVLFVQMIIKHRQFVLNFITECYKTTANPEMHNLIPTNAKGFVGNRQNEILSVLQQS